VPGRIRGLPAGLLGIRHSRPAVVVRSTQTGCGGSQITADGRTQPSLADDGTVAALADQVVSVHWEL